MRFRPNNASNILLIPLTDTFGCGTDEVLTAFELDVSFGVVARFSTCLVLAKISLRGGSAACPPD